MLQGRAYHPALHPHTMSFGGATSARLGRDATFFLAISVMYRFGHSRAAVEPWQVQTVGYLFDVLDREEHDIVSYHWHPASRSPVSYPHLHVGGRTSPFDLSKVHLPTGRVALVDIVRMAITELGVEPLRLDWEDVLDQAERDLSSA